MRGKNRKPIASCLKLPQFTTMNVIDGQAGLIFYASLIFYSLTINNILNIIVLLILAGVSISMLTGENGILNKAKEAKEKTEVAKEEEQRSLAMSEAASNLENKEFQGVTIPAGFAPTRIEGESTVDEGLVIIDSKGNEFVWIPVPKAIATVDDELNDETKLGIDFKGPTPMATLVKDTENYRGILYENWAVKNDGSGTVDVQLYSATSDYGEPRVVTGVGTEFDADDFNLTVAGITKDLDGNNIVDSKDLEYQMQKDYNEMVKSVEKYGGFYVARYEMSLSEDEKVQYQKEKESYNNSKMEKKQWYEYYKKQREFATVNNYGSIKSSMIWGSQYDAMMNWMARCGIDVMSDVPKVGEKTATYNKTRITGGEDSNDVINNVYDLLGNSVEMTLEAHLNYERVCRGGHYMYCPYLCYRYIDFYAPENINKYCSRLSLYIM